MDHTILVNGKMLPSLINAANQLKFAITWANVHAIENSGDYSVEIPSTISMNDVFKLGMALR